MEDLTQAEPGLYGGRLQTSPDVALGGFQSCTESRSLEI